jgi:hypothetical protein
MNFGEFGSRIAVFFPHVHICLPEDNEAYEEKNKKYVHPKHELIEEEIKKNSKKCDTNSNGSFHCTSPLSLTEEARLTNSISRGCRLCPCNRASDCLRKI